MVKKCLIAAFFAVSYLQAGWIEDLAAIYEPSKGFDVSKAVSVVETYVKEDQDRIEELGKDIDENEDDDLRGTVEDLTSEVELEAARAKLSYHEEVLRYVKELPVNKADEAKFTENLGAIKGLLTELDKLEAEAGNATGLADKAIVQGKILANKAAIKARKVMIKSALVIG